MAYFTGSVRVPGGGYIAYLALTTNGIWLGPIVAQQHCLRRCDAERWQEQASVRFIEGDIGDGR